ncbi:SAM-dependent methyltransferase [Vibrio nigripulchritudo ATCC 27043]|uniref:class I SAM-dependent methyltransferase n=1 Tax=Vibrio nigripulchritudo TaxID=28173 RepID=UPI00021C3BCC|nr:methyltransferase domain-containing protein [Vibrio nigripulchritudo]EGU55010.1 SAM-dependent methyltransferase [Vibrio nigripulchritudo ATCC 27043]
MTERTVMPGEERSVDKMPGHWVLARLGKKVLRPGGKALTEKMIDSLSIRSSDSVVEFAPGLGFTARLCLSRNPASYTAIEQNEQAAELVRRYLVSPNQQCLVGNAQSTDLDQNSASIVYGEAMLTMQPEPRKADIIGEAARVLESNGRYGIHELCLVPNEIDEDLKREIQRDIAQAIQAPAKPITPEEWAEHLHSHGFKIQATHLAPMHLLEPKRMIDDEGVLGFLRVLKNLILDKEARKRVIGMRKVFRKHRQHLGAISIVAIKE